jgi:hypothetical protein
LQHDDVIGPQPFCGGRLQRARNAMPQRDGGETTMSKLLPNTDKIEGTKCKHCKDMKIAATHAEHRVTTKTSVDAESKDKFEATKVPSKVTTKTSVDTESKDKFEASKVASKGKDKFETTKVQSKHMKDKIETTKDMQCKDAKDKMTKVKDLKDKFEATKVTSKDVMDKFEKVATKVKDKFETTKDMQCKDKFEVTKDMRCKDKFDATKDMQCKDKFDATKVPSKVKDKFDTTKDMQCKDVQDKMTKVKEVKDKFEATKAKNKKKKHMKSKHKKHKHKKHKKFKKGKKYMEYKHKKKSNEDKATTKILTWNPNGTCTVQTCQDEAAAEEANKPATPVDGWAASKLRALDEATAAAEEANKPATPVDGWAVSKLRALDDGRWQGLAGIEWVDLEPGWVKDNFKNWFLRECRGKRGEAIKVPPGRTAEAADGPMLFDVPNPYQQADGNKCVAFGAAAALQHVGAVDVDGRPFARAVAELRGPDPIKDVTRYVTERVPGWQAAKRKRFDPLGDQLPPGAVAVMQLAASDGDPSHAVGIADNKIFDANHAHAMPLGVDGLDAACLGATTTFAKSLRAVMLRPSKLVRKRAAAAAAE